MLGTVAVIVVVFLILLLAEYLSRYRGVHSELTRKLVHTLVGVFVAFWPFFLSWRQIQMLSVAFLLVVLISIKLNIFGSIHAVKRNVMGEVLFAMIIGILAFISTDEWIFTAAMLHLSLADGLAAIIGLAYGDKNSYKVLGETRSLTGSLTFFFTSSIIMLFYTIAGNADYSGMTLIGLPVIATIAENFAIKGTDNLIIPLLVAFTLTSA
jgi:dolichol kinase